MPLIPVSVDPEKLSFSSSRTFGNPLKIQRTYFLLNQERAKENFVRSILEDNLLRARYAKVQCGLRFNFFFFNCPLNER